MYRLHYVTITHIGKIREKNEDNFICNQYVKDMEEDLKRAERARVFITHSGIAPGVIDEVKAYLESLQHFDAIYVTRAGGVISSHCGPGTLGVLFVEGK